MFARVRLPERPRLAAEIDAALERVCPILRPTPILRPMPELRPTPVPRRPLNDRLLRPSLRLPAGERLICERRLLETALPRVAGTPIAATAPPELDDPPRRDKKLRRRPTPERFSRTAPSRRPGLRNVLLLLLLEEEKERLAPILRLDPMLLRVIALELLRRGDTLFVNPFARLTGAVREKLGATLRILCRPVVGRLT